MKNISLCLLLVAVPVFAADQKADEENDKPAIYRSTDSQGNPVFSDQPSRDAERIELKEPNRTPAVTPKAKPAKKKTSSPQASYQVTISSPEDDSFIVNGLLPTSVSIKVTPPVLPKHKIEFLLDGESISIGSAYSTTIERLRPGSHQISARIVDQQGEVLGQPDSVRVTAQWPGNH